MTFTTTPNDLITIGMRSKLTTICPNGKFEIAILFNEQFMGYQICTWAIAQGERVKLVDQWMPMDRHGTPLNDMSWADFISMFEVSDQLYAMLMLLYPDNVTS